MSGLIKHRFVLTSRWHLDCAIGAAWQCIGDVRRWPEWWPNVAAVRIAGDVADGDDALTPCTITTRNAPRLNDAAWIDWKTRLGYGFRLRVVTTRVLPPFELEGSADGDLIGQGLWVLEPLESKGGGVLVTYRWDLHLHRPWMRAAAPLLRPVFAWNHFDVMRTGAKGMARNIGCRLLSHQDYRFSHGASDATAAANNARALPWHDTLALPHSPAARGALPD